MDLDVNKDSFQEILSEKYVTGNAGLCRQVPQSASMRDVEWASQNCVLSFSTIGIWPEGADGTDVNACARSHNSRLITTADDFGKVKLYSYPTIQPRVRHCYFYVISNATMLGFQF